MVDCLVVHDKSMTTFLLAAKIFPPKKVSHTSPIPAGSSAL